jgi:hypothetical protein
MSKVVWVDCGQMSFENSMEHKLLKLLAQTKAIENLSVGMKVAVKINAAEMGYEYGLRPGFIRVIADQIKKKTQKIPAVCDGHRLIDYWNRTMGSNFLQVASNRGYSSDILGGDFVINGGYSGDEGDLFSCGTQSELGGVEIGTVVCRSDTLWVISHVTFHPLFGMSGALLNGGFECLSCRAKTRILNGLSPYQFNGQLPAIENLKTFRQRAIECNRAIGNALENQVFYVNILWDVTPQPEYYPYSNTPVMENQGFLASYNPVALDSATFSIIEDHIQGSEKIDPDFRQVINLAQDLGIGQSEHTMVRLS